MSDNRSKRLQDRVALITGGGNGIGKAIATSLAKEGARTVVAGRSIEPLQAVAGQIGGRAIVADMSDERSVDCLFQSIEREFGRLDILVNNAGVPGPILPIDAMDVAAWDACIAVNLRGAMLAMRSAARMMRRQRAGSIINMSSLMGLQGYPMRTAYSATKFALIGMTQAAARELGPHGIRVNALCPGAVHGENMDRIVARRAAAEGRSPEAIIEESYTKVAALRRWVTEEEVAQAASFLASDDAASITGEQLKVDAGRF